MDTKVFVFNGVQFLKEIKVKIKNCDQIKLKIFYKAKKIINKMKRYSTEWENICKWGKWQGINLQNLQTAHAAQLKRKKEHNPIKNVQRT